MTRGRKVRISGILLGIGLGGLLEGILLHWSRDNVSLMALWLISAGGVAALWQAVRGPGPLPRPRAFVGYLLAGCGAFDVFEAVAVHRMFTLAPASPWDWLFLGLGGIGLIVFGVLLARGPRETPAERRSGYDRRAPSVLR